MLEDDVRRPACAQLGHHAEQQAVDHHDVGRAVGEGGEHVATQAAVAEHRDQGER